MSGFRTLHRITNDNDGDSSTDSPVWRVKFSPCRSSPSQSSSLRLLAAGASNTIKCYSLSDRSEKDVNSNDVLDASAMNVTCTESLLSRDDYEQKNNSASNNNTAVLGYAALDVVRNYCGADDTAGNEVVMASKLGGHVCVWVRLDPVLKEKGVVVAEDISNGDESSNNCGGESSSSSTTIQQCRKPYAEFKVPTATGTTLAIRPPLLGNYYSKKETEILVALGCANGAVVICKSGILASRPGDNGITRSTSSSGGGGGGAVVGDTGGEDTVVMNFTSFHNKEDDNNSNSAPPGEIIATVGGGHACVMSLAWHPTIPNTFVVGRKDGIVDIYSAHTTSDDYYYGHEGLNFRRVHRLVHSSFPIRALSYSMPEGELLFAGDDDGKLYSYDASLALSETSESFNVASPVKLVACALAAHKGWIMNLCAFPDGNRVATCGSDKSVRVWDCGMGLASGTPVHSFDGANEGWVWGVDCSSGAAGSARLKLVGCGNDGSMQVFSCSE
mmetsp:Transcript_19117/g.29900  ORF Transcript_19117/g.29900 Transcript_19117/m.29900 type:complete len:501 (+) Transcript_19117:40-1542(+)